MAITRDFLGGLNTDSHPSRVARQDYIDALNITMNGSDLEDDVVTNIVGNQKVDYTQTGSASDNACVGCFADTLRNRVYFMVWNRDDYHSIQYYDKAAGTVTKVIESKTDSVDEILNFQLKEKINGIDIIHTDEGDLMFFT
jgi:hypothetical protein